MTRKRVAIILSGAVAKGAYEAGVLRVLAAQPELEITRIVAASSGALNAACFAHAIAMGEAIAGADALVELWRDRADFWEVFSLHLRALVRGEGFSDQRKLRRLLASRLVPGPAKQPISLRIVIAPLEGHDPRELAVRAESDERAATGRAQPPAAKIAISVVPPRTTYENVQDFDELAFESQTGVDRVITAAVASSAFPFAFVPVDVEGLGPCIDGGTVNNTPVKWALGGPIGDQLDAIAIVSPKVELDLERDDPGELRGARLADRVLTMLIDERLNRDLAEAEKVNEQLRRLRSRIPEPHLTAVLEALEWQHAREIRITSIQPETRLRGSAFTGFRDPVMRAEYIAMGEQRAREKLSELLGVPDGAASAQVRLAGGPVDP